MSSIDVILGKPPYETNRKIANGEYDINYDSFAEYLV
jgi:hypothetical protein